MEQKGCTKKFKIRKDQNIKFTPKVGKTTHIETEKADRLLIINKIYFF